MNINNVIYYIAHSHIYLTTPTCTHWDHILKHIHIHTHTHAHTHTYIHTHTHIYIYIYIYTHTSTYTCIYACMHQCTYTYSNTHIHIYMTCNTWLQYVLLHDYNTWQKHFISITSICYYIICLHLQRFSWYNLSLNSYIYSIIFSLQDLSITIMSDLPSSEVEIKEDPNEVHKIYKQSFIDEQVGWQDGGSKY